MITVWYSIYNFGMGEGKNKFLEISCKKKRIEHCLAMSKKFHSKYAYLQFAFSHDHIVVITVSVIVSDFSYTVGKVRLYSGRLILWSFSYHYLKKQEIKTNKRMQDQHKDPVWCEADGSKNVPCRSGHSSCSEEHENERQLLSGLGPACEATAGPLQLLWS